MLPTTRDRVPAHTSRASNKRIHDQMLDRLRYFAGHPAEIERRFRALDAEWDIERAIEMNASALAFTGVALGSAHDKRWLVLSALVTGFLFQHAVQGWCPPVPLLRKLGFRTVHEIEQERYALKALRGDFAEISSRRRGPAVRRKHRRTSAAKLPMKKAA